MKTLRLFSAAACVSMLTIFASSASATTITYNFDLNMPNGNGVTDIIVYSAYAGGDQLTFLPDTLSATGVQSLSYSLAFDPSATMVIGYNPGAGGALAHIVMFENPGFAAASEGLKWSQIFSSPGHNAFLAMIPAASGGDASAIASLTTFFRGAEAASAMFQGNDYTIVQYSVVPPPVGNPVPEPGTIVLLGSGVAGVVALIRRRRRA